MAAESATGSVTLPRETIALLESKAVAEGKTIDELANDSINAHLKQSRVRQAAKAAYKPQTHLRERAIVPKEAALLFIDIQNYNCHRSGAEAAHFGTVSLQSMQLQNHRRVAGSGFRIVAAAGLIHCLLQRLSVHTKLQHAAWPYICLMGDLVKGMTVPEQCIAPCRAQTWSTGGRGWRRSAQSGQACGTPAGRLASRSCTQSSSPSQQTAEIRAWTTRFLAFMCRLAPLTHRQALMAVPWPTSNQFTVLHFLCAVLIALLRWRPLLK